MTSLRNILSSWLYVHVSSRLSSDRDIEENKLDLAIPRPGNDMFKFYTLLLKPDIIMRDEGYEGRFEHLIDDDLHFRIPEGYLHKPVTWKHLKSLCRLLTFFNSMRNNTETFQQALEKHLPLVIKNLESLEKTEAPYKSLLSVLQLPGNLGDTVAVFNAFHQLINGMLAIEDMKLSTLFKLEKRQTWIFVNSVLESARELFEPIMQYLPAKERTYSTIVQLLLTSRVPESLLQQTLWRNLETRPLYDTSLEEVERLQTTDQQQGSLCWEFITGLISMKYYTEILNKEVFNGKELKKLQNVLNAQPDADIKGNGGEDQPKNFVVKRVFKLSMYSIGALLVLSSKTMLQCRCAAKTRKFISLVFSLCDEIKLQAKSLKNSQLLVFAAHEISKFPMVRPTDRCHFRNLFITYRQKDIFERSTTDLYQIFQYKYLNELNFVRQIQAAGLEPTYFSLLYLLLTLKNDRTVLFSDVLYHQLLHAICCSFDSPPIALEWNKPEEIEKYCTLSSGSALLKLYANSSYNAFTIFCLAYVHRMAYFTQQPLDSMKHLLPMIHLMYFNMKNDVYPITSAFLGMYIQHLPGDHMKSIIDGAPCTESLYLETQTLFKYLSLVVNVMMMEQTKGQYTMVDFIEQSGQITLY